MTRLLLDEMAPTAVAELLRDEHGCDALHVREVGLAGALDADVAAEARRSERALVTENVADFAGERDLVLVFVLKRNLPAGGGQAAALAGLLAAWEAANPAPYQGAHWPV